MYATHFLSCIATKPREKSTARNKHRKVVTPATAMPGLYRCTISGDALDHITLDMKFTLCNRKSYNVFFMRNGINLKGWCEHCLKVYREEPEKIAMAVMKDL